MRTVDFRRRLSGFTLVELLIVIATIGILASIGILSWNGVALWSQNQQRGQELVQWKSTYELYKTRFGLYPEPAGTIPFTFCLGDDFVGDQCKGALTYNESSDLMTQIKKVSKLPTSTHPKIADTTYIGPYVMYGLTTITLYGAFGGTGSGTCPKDTTYDAQLATGVVTCKIVLNR
jgi:prepilin-type N-terminal cleavage/methylation domain-containing protein